MRRWTLWGRFAVAAGVVVLAGAWLRATRADDMPWMVWKLEGTAERGATPLPVLRVAAQPDGEEIDGDWTVVRVSSWLGADGQIAMIWERLERTRKLASLWRWWGRRTGRPWLEVDCTYRESSSSGGTTVTTTSGRWRRFVRDPLPGDTWPRRPDPSLVGKWGGWLIEGRHASSLELRADGSVEGLAEPPGCWGVRDDVLIVTWGEGTESAGFWSGARTGPASFGELGPGTLERE